MNLHIEMTINLWWLVYYLATGFALWPPLTVVAELVISSSNGRSVGQRLRTYQVRRCIPRIAFCAVAWPLVTYIYILEGIRWRKAVKRIAAIQARRQAALEEFKDKDHAR